jgi:hypothetical protein
MLSELLDVGEDSLEGWELSGLSKTAGVTSLKSVLRLLLLLGDSPQELASFALL